MDHAKIYVVIYVSIKKKKLTNPAQLDVSTEVQSVFLELPQFQTVSKAESLQCRISRWSI